MSWKTVLHEMKHSAFFKKLLEKVNRLYRERTVYPPKKHLFRAFELTPYEEVKIVILGQDPYHQKGQAMGLAFSVQPDVQIPPSLKNIYKELENDLGVPPKDHGDLTNWAKQGVLLLNTTLTVEDSTPGAHHGLGWETFTDFVIQTLDRHEKPLVFMLWGAPARKKKALLKNSKHLVLEASHPSPLSAHRSFLGCGHFSKANRFLKRNGRNEVDFSQ